MAENKITLSYNPNYPLVQDLKVKTKKRIPKFAFDYLDGGCNEDINLVRNKSDLQDVQLMPNYLKKFIRHDRTVNLFGHKYDAPFGISTIGLQRLIWPKSPAYWQKLLF
jgi:L-lactate dehydrogenase (cytochrome)